MLDITDPAQILAVIPQRPPFRFVDELLEVNERLSRGIYHFKEDEYFYQGHFPGVAVTPSVILIECMAQAGLTPLGIYHIALTNPKQDFGLIKPIFTNSETKFIKPVYPDTKVTIEAENIYFRINRLKAKIKLWDDKGDLCCSGFLSGVFVPTKDMTC